MKLLIDADGCPVVDIALETVKQEKRFFIEAIILCDTSHRIERQGTETITVSKGADSVDFALCNRCSKGDVVITQDYGLAAMCLAKKAVVLNQDGMIYTESNIDGLLDSRHFAKKVRMSGGKLGKLKGQKKRSQEQNEKFKQALAQIFSSVIKAES